MGVAEVALAQPGAKNRINGMRFDVHGNAVGAHTTAGVGARIEFPIVPNGFLKSSKVADELAISGGVDFLFWSHKHGRENVDHFTFMLPIVAQWNIYFHEKFSAFPEAGFGIAIHDGEHDYYNHRHYGQSYFGPFVGGGFRWHFSDSMSLLVRGSYPAGLQVGVTFM